MQEADKNYRSSKLIKSKKRVADHGEVFTPSWLVEAMIDLTDDSDRIESRFLESACGNGNFLITILQRKLAIVELQSLKSNLDKKYFALIAVMSIYGIEILEDNIIECRKRLLSALSDFLKIEPTDEIYRAASNVLSLNLIHGDSLQMCDNDKRPIVFSEWEYLGRDKFQRREFRFDMLAQNGTEVVPPIKTYKPITLREIAYPNTTIMREANL